MESEKAKLMGTGNTVVTRGGGGGIGELLLKGTNLETGDENVLELMHSIIFAFIKRTRTIPLSKGCPKA